MQTTNKKKRQSPKFIKKENSCPIKNKNKKSPKKRLSTTTTFSSTQKKKKMWAILSKYFYPLFSPIREDCVLVGEERKLVGPTKISLFFFFFLFFFFPSSTKQPKTSFLPTFLSFIFHPPYNKNLQLNQKKKKRQARQHIYVITPK